jgi:hypothetical protein
MATKVPIYVSAYYIMCQHATMCPIYTYILYIFDQVFTGLRGLGLERLLRLF